MKIIFYIGILSICFLKTAKAQEHKQKQLDYLLIKKRTYHKRIAKKGYCIQIYNGTEKQARGIKENCKVFFSYMVFKLVYEEPDWKVQTGNFITKLSADKNLNEIQKKYDSARVLFVKKKY